MIYFKTILVSCLLAIGVSIKAQDTQKCFLIAYAQKRINPVCGTGQLVKSEPWELPRKKITEFRNKLYTEFTNEYSSTNGYSERFLEVVRDDQVIIYCKTTRVYVQNIHQYDCTSTYYVAIIRKNFAEAEKALETYKLENKEVSYTEVGRWPQQTK